MRHVTILDKSLEGVIEKAMEVKKFLNTKTEENI